MEKKYNPASCEHKLPNGFSSWMFHSETSGSGPDFYHDVSVCICTQCGTIRIAGFRQGKDGKLNRFNEEIDIHAEKAVDAIIKYANYIHEEKIWGRITQPPAEAERGKEITVFVPCSEDDPRCTGSYTSSDGQCLCHVRGTTVPVIEQGAVWLTGQYDRLYDQLKAEPGKQIVCFVDYTRDIGGKFHHWRDICTIRGETMEFLSRGRGYGMVRNMKGDEKTNLISLCEEMQVQWLDESGEKEVING